MEEFTPTGDRNGQRRGFWGPRAAERTNTDGDFIEILADKAAKIVATETQAREERRRRTVTTVLTLAGVVGLTGIFGLLRIVLSSEISTQVSREGEELQRILDQRLEKELAAAAERQQLVIRSAVSEVNAGLATERADFSEATAAVPTQVDAAVQGSVSELETQLEEAKTLQQLVSLALSADLVEKADGFSHGDLDAIMGILREVAGAESVLSQPQFGLSLGKLVTAFASAGLGAELAEVDNFYRDHAARSPDITAAMATFWGQDLVGSAVAPADRVRTLERFEFYAEVARRRLFPEVALLWRLLLDYKAHRTVTDLGSQLATDAAGLNDIDRNAYVTTLIQLMDCEQFQNRCTPEGMRLAAVAQGVVGAYGSQLMGALQKTCASSELPPEYAASCQTAMLSYQFDVAPALQLGQVVKGSLESGDWTLGEVVGEVWVLKAPADVTAHIELSATSFDALLMVLDDRGERWSDDDSGDGCDARLTLEMRKGINYLVMVTSAQGDELGAFTLLATDTPLPEAVAECVP